MKRLFAILILLTACHEPGDTTQTSKKEDGKCFAKAWVYVSDDDLRGWKSQSDWIIYECPKEDDDGYEVDQPQIMIDANGNPTLLPGL